MSHDAVPGAGPSAAAAAVRELAPPAAAWRPSAEVRPARRRLPPRVLLGLLAEQRPGRWRPAERVPHRRRGGQRVVQALERLVMAPLAGVRPRQPGEVAAWRLVARAPLRVPPLDVREQQAQRPHVLLVVDHDARERVDRPASQHVEVDRRDLPALDIADPADAQQLALDGAQPRVLHPVLEHPAHERQQVEVPGVGRRGPSRQPVAGLDQRPVEAAPVVRHEPRVGRHPAGDLGEQRGLVGVIGEQQLGLAEARAVPAREADEERERPGRGREPGRLGVEAHERRVRRRVTGEPRQPLAVHRDVERGEHAPDEPAIRRVRDVGAERGGEPRRELRAPAARERRPGGDRVRTGRRRRPRGRASPAGSRAAARA